MEFSNVSPTCELPLEIVEAILSHLKDDKATLFLCAVVSRQFLMASRLHLFRSVTLTLQRGAGVLRQFTVWLDTVPYVACFIRSLTIGDPAQTFEADATDISFAELAALLGKLPVLQTVRLCNTAWPRKLDRKLNTTPTPLSSSVKRLDCRLSFRPGRSDSVYLYDIICSLPSLTELEINGGSFRTVNLQDLPACQLPNLKNVKLDFVRSVQILPSFNYPGAPRPLKSLSVATGPLRDVVDLISFTTTQPSLAELNLRLGYHDCLGKTNLAVPGIIR